MMVRWLLKQWSLSLGGLRGAYGFIALVWHDYVADNGNLSAAAVSFFVFLVVDSTAFVGDSDRWVSVGLAGPGGAYSLGGNQSVAPGLASKMGSGFGESSGG